MVKIVDLPIASISDLDSSQNYMVVTGTNLSGGFATARVSLATVGNFYNNVGALTSSGVQTLVDSNYVYSLINNSSVNNLTKPVTLPFSSVSARPTTLSGYGIVNGITQNTIKDEDNLGSNSDLHVPTQQSVKAYVDASILTKDNTDEITEGSTNLYYTQARFNTAIGAKSTTDLSEGTNLYYTDGRGDSNITGKDLSMGANNITTTGNIISGKSLYSNMYATEAALPAAGTYHGMFAHVHATGKGYFSHGGLWHKLVDETNLTSQIDSDYVTARSAPGVDSSTIINSITDPRYLRNNKGVGTIDSMNSSLQVDGSITTNGDITAFASASERSLKENIERIDNALDKVTSLTGYTFTYKGNEEKVSGLMADEVQAVLPEVVYNFDGDLRAIRYGNMMGLVIEAIKELRADVENLKEKIK